MNSIFIVIPIIIILMIATYTDIKSRLIYDWITLPGMLYFFLYQLAANTAHFASWLLGFLVLGGISFFIAWTTNSLGGGDIKLFALIGLAYGLEVGLLIYFYTYVCAVLYSMPLIIIKKFFPAKSTITSIPMAPFIALGVIVTYMFR
ncbi:prepilin peptidase [Oceanobacillus piezotolerans]|uniref:Prepilin peptidase n=1 Tax=Oceanobacillus piezotolerans TaxID=2448030 RepID=A0A498D755_9BACI|nr:prepilin peptidase [Oceanobacillus piezotolerans]RLL46505.1 prepilin peptidase [Oceanobacillus piezotolerans]